MPAFFESPASLAGKQRLLDHPGDPMVLAEWYRPVFLHYEIDPEILRAQLPPGFELDLFEGKAYVTLVAITMKNFRPMLQGPWYRKLFPLVGEQRFFNVRTYVHFHGEPGLFFFWGWLSRPWGLPIPENPLGLTSSFGRLHYDVGGDQITGSVRAKAGQFTFEGKVDGPSELPEPGSFEEFVLERYSGFYMQRGSPQVFRAWHPAWPLQRCAVKTSGSLPTTKLPWFKSARFSSAQFSTGFAEVWMGAPHKMERATPRRACTSTFFTMPL